MAIFELSLTLSLSPPALLTNPVHNLLAPSHPRTHAPTRLPSATPPHTMADIKQIKDQIWYIKRDIQNEEKKRDEWATTVRLPRPLPRPSS
jgi:hypothetical protein